MSLTVREHPSPNCDARRGGAEPDLLLLHYTGMASMAAALDRLSDPTAKVSCHYALDLDGTVVRMVPEAARAWHAGVSHWAGESDINSRSIGIEIQNAGHDQGLPDYPEPQMRALERLCAEILHRHHIPPERVLAHSDVAPARKIDPGERFDWPRLHRAGIGHWVPGAAVGHDRALAPGAAGPAVGRLQQALADYGYGITVSRVYDRATAIVVAAFQRHWRPRRVDGCADRSTLDTLARLSAARRSRAR